MVEVSVIVPIWNQSGLTHQFLTRNWQLYQTRPEVEFVVVNNGSTDNTAAVLQNWQAIMGSRLQVVDLKENTGFGPGNNRGEEQARGDTLILLSNDVIPTGDYVTIIKDTLEPDVLMGPQLLDYDTGWNTFAGKTLPYMAGWCLVMTRETWDKLGGFDEQFIPCDYEDVDLSYTAAKNGIDLVEQPLPLQHLFGQSAKALSGGRLKVTLANQKRFREKWAL